LLTVRDNFGGNLIGAGMRMPDVVAALRYDNEQAVFSSAQLSVAAREVRLRNRDILGNFLDTEYGYAIQGGVKFSLPMIAAGDALWLQAAYSEGNLSYVGAGNVPTTLGAFGRFRLVPEHRLSGSGCCRRGSRRHQGLVSRHKPDLVSRQQLRYRCRGALHVR
jgi:hypothetical protein